MKKILTILILILIAGCAAKEPPFDSKAAFSRAEGKMQNEEFEDARKAYQAIQEKLPERSYDPVLMLRIADTYFGEKKYSEAQVEYQAFLNYHPVHRDSAYAQYQVAMCSYKEMSTIDRDPTPNHVVIREMRKLLEKYPKSIYTDEANRYILICRDRLAQYELYVAKFYYKKDSYKAAADRCEKLLKNYPGSVVAQDALYYAGLSYMELGERDKARLKFETLAKEYPEMQSKAQSYLRSLTKK